MPLVHGGSSSYCHEFWFCCRVACFHVGRLTLSVWASIVWQKRNETKRNSTFKILKIESSNVTRLTRTQFCMSQRESICRRHFPFEKLAAAFLLLGELHQLLRITIAFAPPPWSMILDEPCIRIRLDSLLSANSVSFLTHFLFLLRLDKPQQ